MVDNQENLTDFLIDDRPSIVWFGSSDFANESLRRVIARGRARILGVVAAQGSLVLTTGAMAGAEAIVFHGSAKDPEFQLKLLSVPADFYVICPDAPILPMEVYGLPKVAALGLQPSLLPDWRGPNPIEWFLLSGADVTGASIYRVGPKPGQGEVFMQKTHRFDDFDLYYQKVLETLSLYGGDLVTEAIEKWESLEDSGVQQMVIDHTGLYSVEDRWGPPVTGAVRRINFRSENSQVIERKLRAFIGNGGVWTRLSEYPNLPVEILEASIPRAQTTQRGRMPGNVRREGKDIVVDIQMGTGCGSMFLKKVRSVNGVVKASAWLDQFKGSPVRLE